MSVFMYYDKNKKVKRNILLLMVFLALVATGFFIYKKTSSSIEDYIIKGNGRVEAREIAIATKFAGRVIELKIDEGNIVKKGQLLAVLDTRSLKADIEAQKAKSEEILKQISATEANIKATKSDINFYKKEVNRTKTLIKQNFSSQSELDKNINILEKAEAQLLNLESTKKSLGFAYDSLLSSIKSQQINLDDMKIYAPTNGVILYKLVENGEMLGQNGKLFIMYNPDDLFMTIYMPSNKAGQVKLNEEARIKLDAYSDRILLAKVTFVAENAEFTPKEVETQQERQKLVFRVKLTLNDNSDRGAKPGMPGDGYIKIDSSKNWPKFLE